MDKFISNKVPVLLAVLLLLGGSAWAKKGAKKTIVIEKKDPSEFALEPGYAQRFPLRVRPAKWEGARIMPDDPDVEGNVVGRPGKLPAELVVIQEGDLPRVVVEDGPVRVLLYYPASSLYDVIIKPVRPSSEPARSSGAAGKKLRVGTPIERRDFRNGFVKVRIAGKEKDAGWVPVAVLGKTYPARKKMGKRIRPKPVSGTGHGEVHPNRVHIKKGTFLLDGPDGSVVAMVKQNNTFYADNYVEPGGWLRLKYASSWGELGMWLNVNKRAFPKAGFGNLLKKGKFFWLDRIEGRLVCTPWQVRKGDKLGFEGRLIRKSKERIEYEYQYAIGIVTLTGPVGLGAGSFEVLELLSCGKECYQVGGNRWYLKKKACERDRIKGKGARR